MSSVEVFKKSLIDKKERWDLFFKDSKINQNKLMLVFENILDIEKIEIEEDVEKTILLTINGNTSAYSDETLFWLHQSYVQEKVLEMRNKDYARTYRGVVAKSQEVIIGVHINLPKAKMYDLEGCILENGIYKKYDDVYKTISVDTFPDGAAYGTVFAVGKDVASDIEIGDEVFLRGMPTNFFFLGGEIYHFINEYDISAIRKDEAPNVKGTTLKRSNCCVDKSCTIKEVENVCKKCVDELRDNFKTSKNK